MEHDSKQAHKAKFYAGTLICYHIGVAVAYMVCRQFNVRAAWIGIIPAAVAMAMVVYENVDLSGLVLFAKVGNEKDM